MNISILHEDEHLLVVNKPPGWVVNRAITTKDPTVQDWVEQERPEIFKKLSGNTDELLNAFISRSGIAHRLDKDTSGALLIAKNPQVLKQLMDQFKLRQTQKNYVALVHGTWDVMEGNIMVPLGRLPGNRRKHGVVIGGKMTYTDYKIRAQFKTSWEEYKDGFSLIDLFPKTGRTHQLRVVLQHLGYPIVSDELYVGRKRYKKDLEWCPRHFLHAYQLGFTHPATQTLVNYTAPLPLDLDIAVRKLKEHSHEI